MAPSFAEVQLPVEPPTKRRRTNGPASPEGRSDERSKKEVSGLVEEAQQLEAARITVQDHNQHEPAIHGDKSAATTGVILTKQAPKITKKAPRARRKLCLKDETEQKEAEQTSWEPRNAGLEDTFIFGLKRQPKPKTGEEITAGEPKEKAKKTAPKARKTTKAKQQLEGKLEPDHDTAPATKSKRPERTPKTTRKKAMASKDTATITTEASGAIKSPMDNETDHGPGDSGECYTAADAFSEETVNTEPKPVKAKPVPERAIQRSVKEAATTVESVDTATPEEPVKSKPAPKRALKRSNEEIATTAESMHTATPEKPTKRPRRQAAISAIEKVAMGYEADLIPVDKLRRAPEVGSKPRKSRKADVLALSAAPLSTPLPITQAGVVIQDSQDCEKNESLPSPPVTVKRGRKPPVKSTKGRVCKSDEQPEVIESLPAKLLSPIKEGSHAFEDKPPRSPKLPAKRGRKPGVTAAKRRACGLDEEREVSERLSTKHVSPATDDDHAPENEQPLPPKPPAKRGRKPGVKATKGRAGAAGEKQEVLQPQPAEHLSPTEEDDHARDDERPLSSKPPAKRGRKPGAKNRKIDAATTHVEPTAESIVTELAPKVKGSAATRSEQLIDTGLDARATKAPRIRRTGGTKSLREAVEDTASTERLQEASEHPRPLAEQASAVSDKTVVIQRSTKQRRALADFDGNIVRRSLPVEGKKLAPFTVDSASPPAKQNSKPRKTKQETAEQADITTNRYDKAQQHLLQFQCSQDEGPSHETTTTPRKRHVIAADEDLDWLFETSESRGPKPAIVRHPATKARRKAADQTANDMDLDEMLAAVAGFSGKLLTGRRGRVVAS